MQFEKHSEVIFIKAIGLKIKAIRISKGIKQNEIAYRCNFDKSSYNNIEAGKRNITIVTLLKIANALGVSITDFFEKY